MSTTKPKLYLSKGSIIISTFQSRKSANKIAKDMISQYESEYLCFFKTNLSGKLRKELKKIHPYKVPEIVEIKMDNIDNDYLRWLISSVS